MLKKLKSKNLFILTVIGLPLFGGVLLLGALHFSPNKTHNNLQPPNTSWQTAAAKQARLQSHLLFFGDMFWGRGINLYAQRSSLKEKYPFSNLSGFGRESYDSWIANMECPSVPGVNQPYQVEVNSLVFNCPSSYLPEAAKWFTAFSIANNHIANQGADGIVASRKALESNGIQYFGDTDPNNLANTCEVVTVGARLTSDVTKKFGLPIALCGYHGLSTTPSLESLALMKKYALVMPVIAYPHMGIEYTPAPTPAQTSLYRAMVDNGADAVFGGHPHWVQPAEVYKNKLIVYSMGDFMFDQPAGETQRGAAIDLTLSLDGINVNDKNLADWIGLGDSCKIFHDDCLSMIKQLGLQKLNLQYHYDIVGVAATKTPGPASSADTALIKSRLNWAKVSAQINN